MAEISRLERYVMTLGKEIQQQRSSKRCRAKLSVLWRVLITVGGYHKFGGGIPLVLRRIFNTIDENYQHYAVNIKSACGYPPQYFIPSIVLLMSFQYSDGNLRHYSAVPNALMVLPQSTEYIPQWWTTFTVLHSKQASSCFTAASKNGSL